MKKVVAILASLNHPRFIKRINVFKELGMNLDIYGFERDYKSPNEFPQEFAVYKIGYIRNGTNYLKRLFLLFTSLNKVFRKYSSDTIFYVTTFDIAIICFIFRRKFIYEVSDMVYVNFPKCLREICRFCDQLLVRRSLLTLMTSEGFNKYLFGNRCFENVVFIHNKMSLSFKDRERPLHDFDNRLKFSFIGLIRYPNTIFRFARIIGSKFPHYEFHFYGFVETSLVDEFEGIINNYSNVFFHGAFRNPDDLEHIYSDTDIVVCCYDTTTINERIAEPNKLYESIYFGCPIIVSENTFLAEKVKCLNCGYVINPFADDSIINFINSIKVEDLKMKSNLMYNIPKETLLDETIDVLKARLLKVLI